MAINSIRYSANIDLANKNNSHTAVLDLIASLKRSNLSVLEVGCSGGYMGAYLKTLGYTVVGVEPSEPAAIAARAVLDSVFIGSLSDYAARHSDVRYDVITLADVLEHIADPIQALRDCVGLLAPNGRVAVSIPNVTHGSVRAMLLAGRWDYQDFGILDRTHLRFVSRRELIGICNQAAMGIQELKRTVAPSSRIRSDGQPDMPQQLIDLVDFSATDDDLLTFQFIALLQPLGNSDAARAVNNHWLSRSLPLPDGCQPNTKSFHHWFRLVRWLFTKLPRWMGDV